MEGIVVYYAGELKTAFWDGLDSQQTDVSHNEHPVSASVSSLSFWLGRVSDVDYSEVEAA